MKKRDIKELRDKDIEALEQELAEKRKHLFDLRAQAVTQKLENPHAHTAARHDVARILTILTEKKAAAK